MIFGQVVIPAVMYGVEVVSALGTSLPCMVCMVATVSLLDVAAWTLGLTMRESGLVHQLDNSSSEAHL
jgi:hypothetical protein